MGITKTEFLEDRIRIHFNLQSGHGSFVDLETFSDVLLRDIPSLPNGSPFSRSAFEVVEKIYLPDSKIVLAFKITTNPSGPQSISDPYVFNTEEEKCSCEKGQVVGSCPICGRQGYYGY